jgi:hypothetical protein
VLEEKRAKQAQAGEAQGVSAGGGERGGTVAISINGVLVGEVSALDLVPKGSVTIRATPLVGKLALEIDGTASGTGSGGGPVGAPYVTTAPDPDLTNEQVLTDGTWIEWDLTTPNVVVAGIIAGSITTTEMGGDVTTAGKSMLTAANAAAQRTLLSLGTAALDDTADFEPAGAVATHAAASNPHPDYLTEPEADGLYAELNHTHSGADITSGTVATARLGSGTADSTTFLRGDGTWDVPAGGGSDVVASAAVISGTAVNSTSAVAVVSRSVTLAAGDILDFECTGTYLNNTGATITPRIRFDVGSFTTTIVDGTTIATNATNRSVFWIRASVTILSTSSAAMTVELLRFAPTAANTRGAVAVTTHGAAWNTSASDQTGTKTCVLNVYSSGTGATQTFTVLSYKFRKNGAI